MRKLAPRARVSHRGGFLIPSLHDDEVNSHRVYLKGHNISIKYKRESKLQIWRLSGEVRMCYPFHPTGRPISHQNEWSLLVYMIPLQDFSPERNFPSGAATGLNSRRCESPQHDFFRRYHVNKYRAKRGNQSELAPARKSPPYHLNSPSEGGTNQKCPDITVVDIERLRSGRMSISRFFGMETW